MSRDFGRFCTPTEFQLNELCYSDGMGYGCEPGFLIDRESYNDYEILYMIEGRLWCCQHGQKIAVNTGEYVLLDMRDSHKYYFDPDMPCQVRWANLNGAPVIRLLHQVDQLSPLPLKRHDPNMLIELLELYDIADQPTPDICLMSEKVYSIAVNILRQLYKDREHWTENPGDVEFKSHLWQYIMRKLNTNLSIEELANEMHLSKFHFIRRFNAVFGVSPMHYIAEEKMRTAKYLLSYTAHPISSISEQLGYANPKYFSQAFKESAGLSPSEFRKENNHPAKIPGDTDKS